MKATHTFNVEHAQAKFETVVLAVVRSYDNKQRVVMSMHVKCIWSIAVEWCYGFCQGKGCELCFEVRVWEKWMNVRLGKK